MNNAHMVSTGEIMYLPSLTHLAGGKFVAPPVKKVSAAEDPVEVVLGR
jgi:hypothetical protein